MSHAIPENALNEFFAEANEILERVNQCLAMAEKSDLSVENIDSLYRDIHTLKGSAQLFGFKNIGMVAHALEACLEPVRKGKVELKGKLLDQTFKCLDLIDRVLNNPQTDLDDEPALRREVQNVVPQLISVATSLFNGDLALDNEGGFISEENQKLIVKTSTQDSNSLSLQPKGKRK